ncbi:hypothetical protein Ancab_020655, partial [Ancistrocladus abbreviatus]
AVEARRMKRRQKFTRQTAKRFDFRGLQPSHQSMHGRNKGLNISRPTISIFFTNYLED